MQINDNMNDLFLFVYLSQLKAVSTHFWRGQLYTPH